MMNLAEYRRPPPASRTSCHGPHSSTTASSSTRMARFQRTARFRGPDLDSAVPAELVAVAGRLNNALRRLGSGWAVFVEAQRHPAERLSAEQFPGCRLGPGRRRAPRPIRGGGRALRSQLFPDLPVSAAGGGCRRAPSASSTRDASAGRLPTRTKSLRGFVDRTDRVLQLVEGFMPECRWLDDGETLTYLHACVSTKRHRVRVPEMPMYLDALLADQPLTGGLEPMLGGQHLRVLTMVGFPDRDHAREFSTTSTGSPFPIAGRRGRSCSTRPTRRGC